MCNMYARSNNHRAGLLNGLRRKSGDRCHIMKLGGRRTGVRVSYGQDKRLIYTGYFSWRFIAPLFSALNLPL